MNVRGCSGNGNQFVLKLLYGRERSAALQILCVGAHCDDIEIGCGATLLALQRQYKSCRIHWLILSANAARRAEALRAMKAFVTVANRGSCEIGSLRDGHLPAHYSAVKEQLESVRSKISADIIFTTHQTDRHQDHRVVGEATWQTFRDHLILEYEIAKYDGGLTPPGCYVPVTRAMAERKTRLLMRLYPTQRIKDWFTDDAFMSLLRIRGIECRSPSGFAEAFHGSKMVIDSLPSRA